MTVQRRAWLTAVAALTSLTACTTSSAPASAPSPAGASRARHVVPLPPVKTPPRHTHRSSPPRHSVFDVSWLTPTEAWALVRSECGRATCTALDVTHTGGRSWERRSRLGDAGCKACFVHHLEVVDGQTAYAYGPGFVVTHDGGRTWSGSVHPNVESVAVSAGVAWRLAYRSTGCPGPCDVRLQEAPAGTTAWQPVRTVQGNFGGAVLASGPDVYVLDFGHIAGGTTSHMYIERSLDGGATWTAREDPCGGTAVTERDAISATVSGDSFAVACVSKVQQERGSVALSTDAGRSFGPRRALPGPQRRGFEAQSLALASPVGPLVVAGWSDAVSGRYQLAVSYDGGRLWRRIRTIPLTHGDLINADVDMVDALSGSVHAAGAGVYVTHDGGKHWRQARLP